MTSAIANVRFVIPGRRTGSGTIELANGRIHAIHEHAVPPNAPLLTPGLIDLHTHGLGPHLYESDPDALRAAASLLPRFGVTCALPTLYRQIRPSAVRELAAALPAHLPGLHLEGPFLALPGAGAQTLAGDVALLDSLLTAAPNRIRAMSVSPDTPGILPVIERLRAAGVTVFLTHTRASVEQTIAAIETGAHHATHFYDVFPVPEVAEPGVRPVGVVETVLADPRVTVDFIADGVHVHPMAIRCALAAKGWSGVVLITDSNIGTGMEDGVYNTPWGFAVRVRAGDAARRSDTGELAGSVLTMNAGMRHLLRWLSDRPVEQVWAMGTLNPARVVGLERKGRLEVGADADLVLWDDDLNPIQTWIGGECVFENVSLGTRRVHSVS
ncbi:MAG: amidohydrolase family protein [Verrucomicrobiae bacterium]|nr:amidohydrolase family protein [Verrucomicrobiae bacterium]